MKIILTYGTFDILHYGHINFLLYARSKGDKLIVGLSTDIFNELKGKKAYYSFEKRKKILEQLRCVDMVFREEKWEQKEEDFIKYNASLIVIGEEWKNSKEFIKYNKKIPILFSPRTPDISTTKIKKDNNFND